MNKCKRAKGKSMFVASLASSFYFSLFSFHLPLTFIHPSSFILALLLPLWLYVPSQVRDLAEELPNRADKRFAILFSSFYHLWATGYSHLALPKGESLFGGDSQAQMFVGSGYSSLPYSSRADRASNGAVGRCPGFDPRRDG